MQRSQERSSSVTALSLFRLTNVHLYVDEYILCKRKHAMNNNDTYSQNTVPGQYPEERVAFCMHRRQASNTIEKR